MICSEVQVTVVSLASLYCAELLDEISSGAEEDDSGVSLDVASELLDASSIAVEEIGSRDSLDSGAESSVPIVPYRGCASSLQLAQNNAATDSKNLPRRIRNFMLASYFVLNISFLGWRRGVDGVVFR